MTKPRDWIASHASEFAGWLTRQRWYGDKSRELSSLEPETIAEVQTPDSVAWFVQVRCRFDDGGESVYSLPLCEGEDGALVDALADPTFRSWLADGFRRHRALDASGIQGARLTWEPLPDDEPHHWASLPGEVLTGEQSNTSVAHGNKAILKIFRKLQPGINPDSEIVAFLTGETAYLHVPRFLGGLVLRFGDGREPVELGAVQSFVTNDGDCWRWLPTALARATDVELNALLEPIALLGRRTGGLHVALASTDAVEAFRPDPYVDDEVSVEERRLGQEVTLTISMLRRQGALSNAECDDLESALLGKVSRASVLLGLPKIRVHGDYHLGQVLKTGDDFVIIDFEGEPSRTMVERRRKYSPLKDVAGMLRSIDYAVSSARRAENKASGDALVAWGRNAERVFTDGYRDAVTASRVPLVPAEDAAFEQALGLYIVEKSLYETRYELDNRPDWLDIPLAGLRRIGT